MIRLPVAAALALISSAVFMQPAQAHFLWLAANDPINLWMARQNNANGNWCCNGLDAHLYYGNYDLRDDGSVVVDDGKGGTIVISPEKVLPFNPADPNPTGTAVWWYNSPDGEGDPSAATTYCFALGPLS